VIVTGSAGRSAPSLAQHAFFFALALTHDAPALLQAQREHRWRGIPQYASRECLMGKTLGIIGLGATGREMARLGFAFGMRVIAARRRTGEVPEEVERVYALDAGESPDEVIATSDVLMLATSLTDGTYHLIDDVRLRRMKPSAILINMARGPVIDERALVEALQRGEIAGAGLDVFESEPLPPDAPIWDAPNVMITPHLTPRTPGREQRVIAILRDNAERFRRGLPLLNTLGVEDRYTRK
jgi:phosphoglycerate dehydrogenase-like enzyme